MYSQRRSGTQVTSRTISLPRAFTEKQLIEGILAGNEYAWTEFHVRYRMLITKCISKVALRFSQVLCEDDVSEVYASLVLKLMENDMYKLRCYDPRRGCCFSTWLGMLAINACYDHLRSVRREPNFAPLSEADNLSCARSDPLDSLEQKRFEKVLEEKLANLTDKDRQFVRLYFLHGFNAEQVAHRLRISVKTVYSKKHKIRSRLERLVQHLDAAA